MKIYLGADHAGYKFKEHIKKILDDLGYVYDDLGGHDPHAQDDYPQYAQVVAQKVAQSKGKSRGILICGTGTGMVIAANKIPGVRAALAYDEYSAQMARADNDTNILTLRAREFPKSRIKKIVTTWLTTPFTNAPRHKRRLRELKALEQ